MVIRAPVLLTLDDAPSSCGVFGGVIMSLVFVVAWFWPLCCVPDAIGTDKGLEEVGRVRGGGGRTSKRNNGV